MNWIPTILFALAAVVFATAAIRFRHAEKTGEVVDSKEVAQGSIRKAKGAHAARARSEMDAAEQDVFLPDTIKDFYGSSLDTREKYVGVVTGKSCVRYGFRDGALFLADELDDGSTVAPGDFVVIDARSSGSNVGRRIRRVEAVEGESLTFSDDDNGRQHRARPITEVVARITHILA